MARKTGLDALEDAPTEALAALEDAKPDANQPLTPTGLSPLAESAAGSIPGFGLVAPASKILQNHPDVTRAALEGGGMAAGEALTGNPLAAGVGGAAGGQIADMLEDPTVAAKATSILLSPGNEAIRNDPEAAAEMLKKFGIRTTADTLAAVVLPHIASGVAGAAKGIGNAAEATFDVVPGARAAAEKIGTMLNPAQEAIKSKLLYAMDKISRSGLFSSDTMAAFDKGNDIALKNAQRILTSDLAGGLKEQFTSKELADLVTTKLNLGEAVGDEVSNTMYRKLDDMVAGPTQTVFRSDPANPVSMIPVQERVGPGASVPLGRLKTFVQDKMALSENINKFDQELVDKTKAFLNNLSNQKDYVNFLDAKNLRSSLYDLSRESNNKSLVSLANQAGTILDKSMEDTAKEFSPVAYQTWRDANSFFKTGKLTFNNDLMAKIILNDEKVAEEVGAKIYDTGSVEHIQQFKAAIQRASDLSSNPKYAAEFGKVMAENPKYIPVEKVNYEDTLDAARRGWLQNLFESNSKPNSKMIGGRELNYQGIANIVHDKETQAALREFFPADRVQLLKDFATAGSNAMDNAPDVTRYGTHVAASMVNAGIGSIVGFGIGKPFGHGVSGAAAGAAAGLGMGQMSAYILTNPEAAKSFISGMKLLSKATSKASPYIAPGMNFLFKAVQSTINKALTE